MKKKTMSITSLLIALMLTFCFSQVGAFATVSNYAPQSISQGKKEDEVTVTFSCSDNEIIMPMQEITVYDGISEDYGYKTAQCDHNGNSVDSITFFDVLVAAHKLYYGDLFTPVSAENYLAMSSSYLSKVFGKSAYSSGFIVNGVMPNDGIVNESYGTYTGYCCDTARINSGDNITFYMYQDGDSWSDFFPRFDKSEYTCSVNEEFTMSIDGYCAMYYGVNDIDTINSKYALPITSGKVYTYDENGTKTLIGTTDSNGKVNVKFDKEGTYKVFVCGTTTDSFEEECPLIISWSTVKVTNDGEKENSVISKIRSVLKWILTESVKIINYIIDIL